MPTAPFRADHVGSLLRADPLKQARAKRAKGEIGADALRAVEDAQIAKIVGRQQQIGLQLATDGEFRRSWWHFDFFWSLGGCERVVAERGIQFRGLETKPEGLKVTGKLQFPADHPMLDHFRYLKSVARTTPR